jgi:hypothetical protein
LESYYYFVLVMLLTLLRVTLKVDSEVYSIWALTVVLSMLSANKPNQSLYLLDEVMRIVIYLITILQFMQIQMTEPVKIFIDNKNAFELCTMLKITHKTSAMNVRVNFIRECINKRVIELHFIQSDLHVADIMTKQLNVQANERHTYRLSIDP